MSGSGGMFRVKHLLPFMVVFLMLLYTGGLDLSFTGSLTSEDCIGPICAKNIKLYALVIVGAVILALYMLLGG